MKGYNNMQRAGEKRISYLRLVLLLLVIIACGRASSYFYSCTATNIAYDDWVSDALQYLVTFFESAKNALGYSAIAYSMWHISNKAGYISAVVFFCCLVVENAAKFMIDLISSSLIYGPILALISLGIQLLYETVILVIAVFAAKLMKRLFSVSNHPRKAKKYNMENSARLAVLIFMSARIISEIMYLIDFLSKYTDITNTEIASCVGSFIYIIVMYGGLPLILCEAAFWFMKRITVFPKTDMPAYNNTQTVRPEIKNPVRQNTKSVQRNNTVKK